jgi:hypothetical protein
VRLNIDTAPTEVTSCNCSICRRYGVLRAYYAPGQMPIMGETTGVYAWDDESIEFHRCRTCASVTHWAPVDKALDRQPVPRNRSNRNLEDKASHAKLGSALGWLLKTRADLLLYYFLDTDDLVTLPVFRLKQWAFGSGDEGGIYRRPEKRQGRCAQSKDSWGRCVPVDLLEAEVGA